MVTSSQQSFNNRNAHLQITGDLCGAACNLDETSEFLKLLMEPLLVEAIERICFHAPSLVCEGVVLLNSIKDLLEDNLFLDKIEINGVENLKCLHKIVDLVENSKRNLALVP